MHSLSIALWDYLTLVSVINCRHVQGKFGRSDIQMVLGTLFWSIPLDFDMTLCQMPRSFKER